MKVIIAGSRKGFTRNYVFKHLEQTHIEIKEVVCGMAKGVDLIGYDWAKEKGIPIIEMPADWRLGKQAGYERNIRMAEKADALIAFWDGESRGTEHMINISIKIGLTMQISYPKNYDPLKKEGLLF